MDQKAKLWNISRKRSSWKRYWKTSRSHQRQDGKASLFLKHPSSIFVGPMGITWRWYQLGLDLAMMMLAGFVLIFVIPQKKISSFLWFSVASFKRSQPKTPGGFLADIGELVTGHIWNPPVSWAKPISAASQCWDMFEAKVVTEQLWGETETYQVTWPVPFRMRYNCDTTQWAIENSWDISWKKTCRVITGKYRAIWQWHAMAISRSIKRLFGVKKSAGFPVWRCSHCSHSCHSSHSSHASSHGRLLWNITIS